MTQNLPQGGFQGLSQEATVEEDSHVAGLEDALLVIVLREKLLANMLGPVVHWWKEFERKAVGLSRNIHQMVLHVPNVQP